MCFSKSIASKYRRCCFKNMCWSCMLLELRCRSNKIQPNLPLHIKKHTSEIFIFANLPPVLLGRQQKCPPLLPNSKENKKEIFPSDILHETLISFSPHNTPTAYFETQPLLFPTISSLLLRQARTQSPFQLFTT